MILCMLASLLRMNSISISQQIKWCNKESRDIFSLLSALCFHSLLYKAILVHFFLFWDFVWLNLALELSNCLWKHSTRDKSSDPFNNLLKLKLKCRTFLSTFFSWLANFSVVHQSTCYLGLCLPTFQLIIKIWICFCFHRMANPLISSM